MTQTAKSNETSPVSEATQEPPFEESPAVDSSNQESGADGGDDALFRQMLEESLKEHPIATAGEVVSGVVVAVDGEGVLVDVGAKNEGVVPACEFEQMGEPLPEAGDAIEVLVQSLSGAQGVRVSALAARRQRLWARVEDALASASTLDARVTAEVKGGLRVNLGGLEAFLPRSEIDVTPVNPAEMLGRTIQVTVLTATRKPENIVVSRKQPLLRELEEKRRSFFESARVGDRVSGVVRRLADFGAFVDVGGVDALLHVSDISWRRLKHPSEALQVGQQITAEIIKLDAEAGKVSLSMRALQEDPWAKAAEKYQAGMRVTGTVRKLLDYGAMVELEPGVEGMIHRSEMSWTRQDVKPESVLAEGDVVDVEVLGVDAGKRRIALSLKNVMENPWQAWMAEHPAGSRVRGTVRSKTDFGMFVRLNEELDGLVHIGNLSWHEPGSEAIKRFSKGDEVECVVLGVDVDRGRISLGIKQLEDDPFEVFLAHASRGSRVSGKVKEVASGGYVIELAPGVEGWLSTRELPKDAAELELGAEVEAKIIELDRKRRRVRLSVRQLLRDEEREAIRNYAQSVSRKDEPSALALELQRKLLNRSNGGGKS